MIQKYRQFCGILCLKLYNVIILIDVLNGDVYFGRITI